LIASPRVPARKVAIRSPAFVWHRLDGAASPEPSADRRGNAAALAGDEDAPMIHAICHFAFIGDPQKIVVGGELC
jgi:hypothetical protein